VDEEIGVTCKRHYIRIDSLDMLHIGTAKGNFHDVACLTKQLYRFEMVDYPPGFVFKDSEPMSLEFSHLPPN
jgi:hypothetical protein